MSGTDTREARGPFVDLGGVVEANPEVFERRPHPEHLALLSVVEGEQPWMYVLPDVTQEQLDMLSEWAAAAVRRLVELGPDPDPWLVGTLADGRWAAQMWGRLFDLPTLQYRR